MLDYLFLPYWKVRLCKIGKNSRIKRGVKILGSGKKVTIGNNFKIWHRCFLTVDIGKINFGDNGHIGVDGYINASKGMVNIGNNVTMGSKVQIYSFSYRLNKDNKMEKI